MKQHSQKNTLRQTIQNLIFVVLESAPKSVLKNLNKTQQKIIDIIWKNPKVTQAEIAEQLNISISAVKKSMKEIANIGILVRVGANKGGYWEVYARFDMQFCTSCHGIVDSMKKSHEFPAAALRHLRLLLSFRRKTRCPKCSPDKTQAFPGFVRLLGRAFSERKPADNCPSKITAILSQCKQRVLEAGFDNV